MTAPNFTAHTMRNYRLVVVFMILLILTGAFSLWNMPKQEFPEFTMPIGMLVAVYPGASAEEVERQVTNRLEDYLFSFSEVESSSLQSTSSDGMVTIRINLNEEGAKNPSKVWGRIRDGLPLLKQTMLPVGVLGMVLLDNFGDASAKLIALDSDDKTYRELNEYVEQLKQELRDVEGITNLHKQGALFEEISIYLDKERMVRFGVNRSMITAVLTLHGITTGGAHADNSQVDLPIYFSSSYGTEREIADQVIYTDPEGKIVRLKDVARVVREYPKIKSYISNNGRSAVLLSMEMQRGGDIVAFGKEIDKRMEKFRKTLPSTINMTSIADQPKVVKDSIISFLGDLLEAILIVVIVMMILFPIRSALVAGMAIPITIMTTMAGMYAFGVPLNNVTLAALIVALGMVVDDSIIIIDGHQMLLSKGHSRWYSSIMSAHSYFPSVSIATVSICLVFVPSLVFIPTLLNDFFEAFVYTIIMALLISLCVAMIVVPIFNHNILGRSSVNSVTIKQSRLLEPIQSAYDKFLKVCFSYPWITITLCSGIVVGGALLFMRAPIKMIPSADRDQFVIEVYTPNGTSIDRTAAITDSVATVMRKDKRVVDVTEFVGQLMPRFMVSSPIAMGSKSFSQMIVRSKSSKATLELLHDYSGYFERYWPDTYVRLFQLSYSMTDGVGVILKGNDLDKLHQAADSVKDFLNKQNGLLWVHDQFGEKIPTAAIDLDPISAAQLGVSHTQIASNMTIKYGGMKAGSVWENDYEVPIMLYTSTKAERNDVGSMGDEFISTSFGGSVPLRQVASVRPVWREANIMHNQGQRAVFVGADVKPGYSVTAVTKALYKYLEDELGDKFPDGITWKKSGLANINNYVGVPLAKSFIVSICIILFLMVLNFRRFRLSFLAMCGTLLALPGAAVGLWLSGGDFGMTSMLGVFSLLGIVMRNSVIMFDYAEELRKQGRSVREAAFEAGHRRMIPIVLTSATTAVGVLPLMISGGTLWPSMGWIICFGTLTATILVVTMMPCAYWKLMDRK
ncbi:MAG: efflux RND transporter permease subunit [Prevotella sp.]|nr:efflux RND transporter permease subunit [Candidatus Equicola faecalis]